MKLDFEIAVDQQTRTHDQIFEGVPDSGCPPVPAGQPRPYLVNFACTNFGILPLNFFEDLNQKSASHNKGFFFYSKAILKVSCKKILKNG